MSSTNTNNQDDTTFKFVCDQDGIPTDVEFTHPNNEGVAMRFTLQELVNDHIVAYLESDDGQEMLTATLAKVVTQTKVTDALKAEGVIKSFISTDCLEKYFDTEKGTHKIVQLLQGMVSNDRIVNALYETTGIQPPEDSATSPKAHSSDTTQSPNKKRRVQAGISEEKTEVGEDDDDDYEEEGASHRTPVAMKLQKSPGTASSSTSDSLPLLVNQWLRYDAMLGAAFKQAQIDFHSTNDLRFDLVLMCFHNHKRYSRSPCKSTLLRKYKTVVAGRFGPLTRHQAQLFSQCKMGIAPEGRTAQNLNKHADLMKKISIQCKLPITEEE